MLILNIQIEYTLPMISGPSEITIKVPDVAESRSKKRVATGAIEFSICFSPTGPGKHFGRVILRGLDCPDVRVIPVIVNAITETSNSELNLRVLARQRQSQNIPLLNSTVEDWMCRVGEAQSIKLIHFSRPPSNRQCPNSKVQRRFW